MRQTWPGWEPEVITNKYVLWVLPVVFSIGNLIVLIWGAKPRDPGKIPRFWWPAIFFLIVAGSAIYWGAMMVTRVKVNKGGKEQTIGSVIGFEVKIYNETDEMVPLDMQEAMVQSRLDGSRRRVGYEVSCVGRCYFDSLGPLTNLALNSSLAHSRSLGSFIRRRKTSLVITCSRLPGLRHSIPTTLGCMCSATVRTYSVLGASHIISG
jgi:hypothetical protein